jgi:uncharacterized protein YcnI
MVTIPAAGIRTVMTMTTAMHTLRLRLALIAGLPVVHITPGIQMAAARARQRPASPGGWATGALRTWSPTVMSLNRHLARIGITLSAAGLLALTGTGIASAHVSAHSPDQPIPGGNAEIIFRSPNESQNNAAMAALQVNFPLDTPLSNASIEPVPGWNAKITMTHLTNPVKMTNNTVTDAVASIRWTANPGSGLVTGQFEEFRITTAGLPTNTTQLVFTATQTYTDGAAVNWNQPTPPGGPEPDHPAPHLSLTTAAAAGPAGSGGVSATTQRGPIPMTSTDNTARWLGGIALALAAAALASGLMRGRRTAGSSGPDEDGSPQPTPPHPAQDKPREPASA